MYCFVKCCIPHPRSPSSPPPLPLPLPPCKGIRNPEYKVSGILLTIKIQRKDWNQVPGIRNPRRRIQSPRLIWIPLHEAQWLINNTFS